MKSWFYYILLLSFYLGAAQSNTTTQSLNWLTYASKFKINEHLDLTQAFEYRQFWFPQQTHQQLSVTGATYKTKQWQLGAHFVYFVQSLPETPFADSYQKRIELRPDVFAGYSFKISPKLTFSQRLLSEVRLFENLETKHFKYSSLRLRFLLKLNYKLSNKFSLIAFNEVFVNALKSNPELNFFDHNRASIGFSYQFNKHFTAEVNYINWYQKLTDDISYIDRNIVRIAIHHHIFI